MIHGFLTEIVGSKWEEKKDQTGLADFSRQSENQMTQLVSGDSHN